MNNNGKNIIEHLFDRSLLADVDTANIQNITRKYPYFGAVQLLLAQKMEQENSSLAEAQIQKTALFFSNPFWLRYQLEKAYDHKELEEEPEIEMPDAMAIENEVITDTVSTPIVEEPVVTTHTENIEAVAAAEENIIVTPEEEPVITIPENIEAGTEIAAAENITVTEEQEPAFEEAVATFENTTATEEPALIETPVAETEKELDKSIIAEEPEEPPVPEEDQQPIEDTNEKLSQLIEQQLAAFKKPVEATDQLDIKSGPYHTIDYFASQGIRVGSNIPADKFGVKVRKFTDWLKQMKSATTQPTDLGTDPETEHLIETIAQSSNETKDIVTEAMAEVLKKQGKTEEALQLYKKLSFLNPSKSAYFAAKIEELNKQ